MMSELGSARLLIAVYAVFSISASARAAFQIATKFEEAPFAYSLSAIAAAIYLLVTVSLTRPELKNLTKAALFFELVGVIVVGTLSFLLSSLFAHPSVWSHFGAGYGFIPLVLPIVGLLWLRRKSV